MKYKNSVAIIRTRNGNTVGCHMVSTYRYRSFNKSQFVYDEYFCESFEIYENVGGQVKVKTFDKLTHSDVEITNEITFDNVTSIEILSYHKL